MTATARRNGYDDPVAYMGVLQATCTCVGILGLESSSLSQPLRRGLRDFSEVPGWKPADTVELAFAIASAYGGKLPFDILAYTWQLAGRDVVPGFALCINLFAQVGHASNRLTTAGKISGGKPSNRSEAMGLRAVCAVSLVKDRPRLLAVASLVKFYNWSSACGLCVA